jgi:hypothetical protein
VRGERDHDKESSSFDECNNDNKAEAIIEHNHNANDNPTDETQSALLDTSLSSVFSYNTTCIPHMHLLITLMLLFFTRQTLKYQPKCSESHKRVRDQEKVSACQYSSLELELKCDLVLSFSAS